MSNYPHLTRLAVLATLACATAAPAAARAAGPIDIDFGGRGITTPWSVLPYHGAVGVDLRERSHS
jgi:hypothetical protein